MKHPIIKIQELKKYYTVGTHTVKALDGVNLEIWDREFIAIIGKSGSGKSTLLHMIGGLDFPSSGDVIVNGKHLSTMKEEELAIFRRRYVGFIFQNYNLIPDFNVMENITFPIELDGSHVDVEYIDHILDILKITDKKFMYPSMLSGGEQQRVAIARALASKPYVILADEPTGSLDTATSHDVIGLLKTISKQFHQTIIIITHDYDIAQLAERIIQIEDGNIVRGSDFNVAK